MVLTSAEASRCIPAMERLQAIRCHKANKTMKSAQLPLVDSEDFEEGSEVVVQVR